MKNIEWISELRILIYLIKLFSMRTNFTQF